MYDESKQVVNAPSTQQTEPGSLDAMGFQTTPNRFELSNEVPESEADQIKQIEATISHERWGSVTYPFRFENGNKIRQVEQYGDGGQVSTIDDASPPTQLSPSDMIREELKLRDERGELTHVKSPLLIKLTSLYRVTIFETKPQMFPMSSSGSDKHLNKVNDLGETSVITLDDIKGISRKSDRNSETVPQTTEHPKFA